MRKRDLERLRCARPQNDDMALVAADRGSRVTPRGARGRRTVADRVALAAAIRGTLSGDHGQPGRGRGAKGEYLVYSAAACAYCHVPREEWDRLDKGERLPLTGHHLFRLPFGDFYSPNLTPDDGTGIGRRSDAELARVLRFGVRADGRAAFPLMEFELTDEDLTRPSPRTCDRGRRCRTRCPSTS